MKKTILVVDDEKNVRDITKAYLENAGYNVIEAINGEEAIHIFENKDIHLIILDVMMPKMNGMKVVEAIRKYSMVPIIMLTAKVDEKDLIRGIKTGADDYIKKPFSMRELMVRVEAIMRRVYPEETEKLITFRKGDLVIDIPEMKVKKEGTLIELTPNEFKILKVFIRNYNIVLSREQLIEKAFGINFDGFDRTIDTHIKNLRQKIEDNHKSPTYIKTVYGMGYQFVKGN